MIMETVIDVKKNFLPDNAMGFRRIV
jgi:hypothetical protein